MSGSAGPLARRVLRFRLLTLNMMAQGRRSECMAAYSIYTQFIRMHPDAMAGSGTRTFMR